MQKKVKVVKEEEIFFHIIDNMHVWGTTKVKKFRNMLIKVHVDKICSFRHRCKARSS